MDEIAEFREKINIKSKVNSGLSRSKSSAGTGRMRKIKPESKPKYRLDLSQHERL